MTLDTLLALLELADRAQKSPAETMWLAALKEQVKAAVQDKANAPLDTAPAPA